MSRNYETHCGRKVVSKQWNHCPYCGDALRDASSDIATVDIQVHRSCDHLASKGNVKGLRCVRSIDHTGKHRYQSVMPVIVRLAKEAGFRTINDDKPLFDF